MKCKNCSSEDIIVRKNYSHGKSGKATLSRQCRACGSTDIELPRLNRRFMKKR